MNSFNVVALCVSLARDPNATHNAVNIALLPPVKIKYQEILSTTKLIQLNTSIQIQRKRELLPFWPVTKLSHSPSSICKLLWHMKFSNRIFKMMPAEDLWDAERGWVKTVESPMVVKVKASVSPRNLKERIEEASDWKPWRNGGKRELVCCACPLYVYRIFGL